MARARRAAALAALAVIGCWPTSGGGGNAEDTWWRYRLSWDGGPSLRVEIDIPPGMAGPVVLQSPPFYPDNPPMPVAFAPRGLRALDAAGDSLPLRDTAAWPGVADSLAGRFYAAPAGARRVTYAIDLAPADGQTFGLPLPGLRPGAQMLDGAYLLLLPLRGEGFAAQWRTPSPARVSISIPSGHRLAGLDSVLEVRDNYGLMFLRGAIDPADSRSFPLRGHAVTVYSTGTDGGVDLDQLADLVRVTLPLVEDSLLPLPGHAFGVGANRVFSGVEGVEGYWTTPDYGLDPVVNLHETVHTWVGIWEGEVDDPWWKEGTTNYLGRLLARQAGLLPDSLFRGVMLQRLDTIPAVMRVALRDPGVRTRLFPPLDTAFGYVADPEGYSYLVYEKGAQAAMILDRAVMEATGGRHSLYDLLRDLIRGHAPAFTARDLEASLARYLGPRAGPFLDALLGTPGAFPQDSLARTYAALEAMGRFGPRDRATAKAGAHPGYPVRRAPPPGKY